MASSYSAIIFFCILKFMFLPIWRINFILLIIIIIIIAKNSQILIFVWHLSSLWCNTCAYTVIRFWYLYSWTLVTEFARHLTFPRQEVEKFDRRTILVCIETMFTLCILVGLWYSCSVQHSYAVIVITVGVISNRNNRYRDIVESHAVCFFGLCSPAWHLDVDWIYDSIRRLPSCLSV